MSTRTLYASCNSNGNFETDQDDGSMTYTGGDLHILELDHLTQWQDLKRGIFETFDDDSGLQVKYFLPNDNKNLITISDDKTLKYMFNLYKYINEIDLYIVSEETDQQNRVILTMGEVSIDRSSNFIRSIDGGRMRSYHGKYINKDVHVVEHELNNDSHEVKDTTSTWENFECFCVTVCKHTNIANFLAIGKEKGHLNDSAYFVFEDGLTLEKFIEQRGELTVAMAQGIFKGILEGAISLASHKIALIRVEKKDVLVIPVFLGGKTSYTAKLSALENYNFYGTKADLDLDYKSGSLHPLVTVKTTFSAVALLVGKTTLSDPSEESKLLWEHLIIFLKDLVCPVRQTTSHIFFWDSYKILDFYKEVSEWVKNGNGVRGRLDAVDAESVFDPKVGWSAKITDDNIRKICEERVFPKNEPVDEGELKKKTKQVSYLVQSIRNIATHYREDLHIYPEFRDPNKIHRFFANLYPGLLPLVYDFAMYSKVQLFKEKFG